MRKISYREAIREALIEEMKQDETVFLLGEDIAEFGGSYNVTQGLVHEFGKDRIRNTPIAESGIIGAAIGSALVGLRPVAEIMFADFSTIAMDQIVNQLAKLRYMTGGAVKLPVVIRMPSGSRVAAGPQHSQSLEALYMNIPGLIVVVPSTPYDAKGLLKSSIREDNPVIFIEHKMLYGDIGFVPEEEYLLSLGKAEIKRKGDDITIVGILRTVIYALKSAEILEKEGISVEIIDLMTLKPLDEETILNSVKKTGKLMIIYEACKTGGVGAEIASIVAEKAFDYLDAPIKRIASLDAPVPFSPILSNYILCNEQDIIDAAFELMGKPKSKKING